MKTATDSFGGSGMYELLRELSEAKPFKAFSIVMSNGEDYYIEQPKDLEFTASGLPKVKTSHRWTVLSVDHVIAIDLEI